MAVPYTFGTATASIPLSQLDSNFATAITLGNTAIQLGNTVTTLNNMTLANVTISSGSFTITNLSATTANVTTANVVTLIVTGNETVQGNTSVTGTATAAKFIPTGSSVTGNGMYLPATNAVGISTNGTNAVYVDASQNVGIGTTTPSRPLVVYGASNSYLALQNSTTGVANTDGLQLIQDATTGYLYQYENMPLVFGTNATERMRIDSSGNLLVGTASSGGIKIQPNGTQGYVGTITPTTRGIEFDNNSSARVYYFTNTSGAAYASLQASAFNVSSDYRLKENILPITNALSQIAKLKPSQFNYKADIETKMPCGENTVTGFIAHELAEVIPYAVSGEKDAVGDNGKPMYQGVDASFLVATLTAAIQEQQALITQLTDRIAALEAK
jgi:hypothetical protein